MLACVEGAVRHSMHLSRPGGSDCERGMHQRRLPTHTLRCLDQCGRSFRRVRFRVPRAEEAARLYLSIRKRRLLMVHEGRTGRAELGFGAPAICRPRYCWSIPESMNGLCRLLLASWRDGLSGGARRPAKAWDGHHFGGRGLKTRRLRMGPMLSCPACWHNVLQATLEWHRKVLVAWR